MERLAKDDWDSWIDIRFVRHKHQVKHDVHDIVRTYRGIIPPLIDYIPCKTSSSPLL